MGGNENYIKGYEIMKPWPTKKLGELLQGRDSERVGKTVKIKKNDYQDLGRYPVVDQGVNLISGYIDDESKLYKGKLPVVIFGDHTRIFKFIDFKFAIGADGTKILQPKEELLIPKYFYYALLGLFVENLGYKRHFSILRRKQISLPPLKIQHQIVERMDAIKKAQELNDKQIALSEELFQSLLDKELNPKGKNWDLVKLGNVVQKIEYGLSVSIQNRLDEKGVPILTMAEIENDGQINYQKARKISASADELKKFKINEGELLFNWRNEKELIGKTGLFESENDFIFASFLLRIITNEKILPRFLWFWLNYLRIKKAYLQYAHLAGNQASYNAKSLQNKISCPLISIKNQQKIVDKLQAAQDYKKKLLEQNQKLQELFNSCLDKAMEGELVN